MSQKLTYFLIQLLLVGMFCACRKKCKNNSYFTFKDQLISEIKEFQLGGNNNLENNIKLYNDSLGFYTDWITNSQIDFNKNAVIYIHLSSSKKEISNCAIYNIDFSLKEAGDYYELILLCCSRKKCHYFRKSNDIELLILTSKLDYKPIYNKVIYD